ncbi:hypothetical protein PNA2_1022 [Pyrococcus sp. NA2]|uniref:glycosyltransferase family 4 protein n=1 Tax=Pyrococcus sp. (strain NA2) TaxID=342949 RepID=UPI000209A9FD|nr:glycosyltransferase family 4 protein [Pyrococcus sp. NA2]AEC51938.1 hypothetical protein PNA2_1022 [Pyrococcus sp. NA2]
MRVLILANDFPTKNNEYTGLIFVKEQVKELAKLVDEINVIVPIPKGIEKFREHQYGIKKIEYENYRVGDNVNVYFVKYINPLFPLTFYKFKKEWLFVEYRAVEKFIRRKNIKFDIIHAHYSWPCGALGVKLKKKYKVPLIITEHTHITLKKRIENKEQMLKWTWNNTDILISVNKRNIELIKQFEPSLRVVYIPNGYNPGRLKIIPQLEAREYLNIPEKRKVLFNLARLLPYKGHSYLIDAMKRVIKERDDVYCFIGGSGPLKEKLQQQIVSLGLQNYVTLLGFIPDEELALWMNAADIFVLPSLSEGNPTVMFEALGVGLPFVGTAVGGVPEIITSEDYGLLCPPANPECLAEKILIALDKEWDREKIRRYAEQFTWENIAIQTLDVYNKVIEGMLT